MTCQFTSLSNPERIPGMFLIFSEDICLLLYHSEYLIWIYESRNCKIRGRVFHVFVDELGIRHAKDQPHLPYESEEKESQTG